MNNFRDILSRHKQNNYKPNQKQKRKKLQQIDDTCAKATDTTTPCLTELTTSFTIPSRDSDGRVTSTAYCNYFITNSVFVSCSTTDFHGGGVCLDYSTDLVKLYVDHTSFYNCTCSSLGGGIYLNCLNGESGCVLNFVCGVKCHTIASESGQFDYIYLNSANSYNYVLQSSITDCQKADGYSTLSRQHGNILFRSVNLTNNVCKQTSTIYYIFICFQK